MKIPIEIKQFFESVPFMAFSTTDKNNNPNVNVVASKKIINDNTLWIIDTFFDKTKENILQNNKVAIAMWKGKEGYQFKGTAKYHSKGKIFEKAKQWILKLKPQKIVKGVVEVKVSEIFFLTPKYDKAGKKII